MAIVGICPYFIKVADNKRFRCECGKFVFPDKVSRRELLYGYCAHPTGYESCPLKLILDKYYYERKFPNEQRELEKALAEQAESQTVKARA